MENQFFCEKLKIGDQIYVPSKKMDASKPFSLENCDVEEGLATISRIVEDHLGNLYIYCTETGGCIYFKWNEIKDLQEEIKRKKGYSRAFLKFKQ